MGIGQRNILISELCGRREPRNVVLTGQPIILGRCGEEVLPCQPVVSADLVIEVDVKLVPVEDIGNGQDVVDAPARSAADSEGGTRRWEACSSAD